MQAVWQPCPGQKLPSASVGKKFLHSAFSSGENLGTQIRADLGIVLLRLLPAMQDWCLKGSISSIIQIDQSH